jgi:hypothetical protein
MNACFSVLAAVVVLGMAVLLIAWQRHLNADFQDALTMWAATRQLTIVKARYVFPIMTLEPFVWRHPNDAVYKVKVQSIPTGDIIDGWVAFGRDSFGAFNGTITPTF